ncbi:RluA family pseudouridine synthase [Acinetobacter sp.]|jgi:tRNA pseudouridine32 synthase/23S rRNA pseudouridine746 synthase|uniref:RluA family pseudouridine synthase n=1 Tax=Acinetobacter sp. TaxID=472 RepID=UPI00281991B4|nr:RluA family pseudouridine synthase [Acinetobacter sp.]MDR0235947.1 RluA family pseudouridine synthase [Acinetobacter sp.]
MKSQITLSDLQPPMRDGVTASKVYLPCLENPPKRLLNYLCDHFPHISAKEWQQRFEDQLILDMQGQILLIDHPYTANTHIYYYRFLAHEIAVPFEEKILFENDDLIVVDKPHFLTISPSGQYIQETLLVRLKKTTNNPDLTPIHRLDRETAGVVLFSKRPQTRGIYQKMFADRLVKKTYQAIAPYNPDLVFPLSVCLRMEKGEPFYTMQVTEGTANSHTEIEMLEHHQGWAKYQLYPSTGKQHQLRVHLNWLNIAIKYDPFYPEVMHKDPNDFSQPLQLLAHKIEFIDPITQQQLCFCSAYELTL